MATSKAKWMALKSRSRKNAQNSECGLTWHRSVDFQSQKWIEISALFIFLGSRWVIEQTQKSVCALCSLSRAPTLWGKAESNSKQLPNEVGRNTNNCFTLVGPKLPRRVVTCIQYACSLKLLVLGKRMKQVSTPIKLSQGKMRKNAQIKTKKESNI